ncbi:GNAT family N-acetyltransferase [Cellulomonas sp. S1-8]|uniref:GNAT family N-acetyltransferase n=1 Tax=Cellulomonas sp. S1-8 TaxID=2904790 RepID=UPI002244BC38|nr:GNAT family N-acetyltransferase [Cellulomonas sp. S1-8]UZN03439.1 GNAT family N-acetyltransferase [Cellulomonas sp. S1-8]
MIVVSAAAPGDLVAAAGVLAEAFVDDPVTGAVVGGSAHDRLERTRHLFLGLLPSAIAHGTVDVARHVDRPEILGVALWEAPDAATSVLRLAARLPSFWRALGPGGLYRGVSTKIAIDRHRPRQPHWYLQEIGVAAAARGQGVGGALIHARLASVDAQDAAAYLESSSERNRRLYRRHDFVEVAVLDGVVGSPTTMWRASASDRSVGLTCRGARPCRPA